MIDYKAHNYSSSIYVLSGENRSIQFILPGTSNTSLMVNRDKGYTQYAKSNLGMIGIEVEPVKDTNIWAESGKSYAELTVEDMKAAFANIIQVLKMLLSMVESLRIQVLKMVRGMWRLQKVTLIKVQLVRLIFHLKIIRIICTILAL